MPTPQVALTLKEAAAALGVSPQRISQRLSCGTLRGPVMGPGRAPKGAGRVWQDEIDRVIRERGTGASRSRRAKGNDDQQGSQSAREAAALEAALRMKIGLDEARRLLREERQASKRLVSMLAGAVAELARAQAGADSLDEISEAYSEALTQFLTPDRPTE
jgi:hypothetical protein